jgi:hypothetical protein
MNARLLPRSAIVIGLWLFGVFNAGASEWQSEELNCAITFPDGWHHIQLPESKVAVQSEDKTKTIFLIVQEVPRNVTVNDAFIAGARQAFTRRGGKIVSESRPTIQQLPALEIVGRVTRNGTDISMRADTVIAGGKLYRLEAMDIRRDVLEDQAMSQSLASFRFLQPYARRSEAYRMGYLVLYLFVAVGISALVALAVTAIVRKGSGRNRKPPPLPQSSL